MECKEEFAFQLKTNKKTLDKLVCSGELGESKGPNEGKKWKRNPNKTTGLCLRAGCQITLPNSEVVFPSVPERDRGRETSTSCAWQPMRNRLDKSTTRKARAAILCLFTSHQIKRECFIWARLVSFSGLITSCGCVKRFLWSGLSLPAGKIVNCPEGCPQWTRQGYCFSRCSLTWHVLSQRMILLVVLQRII